MTQDIGWLVLNLRALAKTIERTNKSPVSDEMWADPADADMLKMAANTLESLTKPISEEEVEAAVRAYSGYVAHEKLPNSVRASFEDMGFALEAARKVRG